jgi:hypothetical protein
MVTNAAERQVLRVLIGAKAQLNRHRNIADLGYFLQVLTPIKR